MIKILEWIKNPNMQRILMLVTIFIMAFFLFKGCGRTNIDDDKTKMDQNIAYYKDSLKIQRNKANELEAYRAVLAVENGDLKNTNKEL